MTIPASHGLGTENWPHCWACSRRAPKQSNNQSAGWVSRPIRITGAGRLREVYCGSCFREHGWPDWARIDRDWQTNYAEQS